jgi:hypothetical protein
MGNPDTGEPHDFVGSCSSNMTEMAFSWIVSSWLMRCISIWLVTSTRWTVSIRRRVIPENCIKEGLVHRNLWWCSCIRHCSAPFQGEQTDCVRQLWVRPSLVGRRVLSEDSAMSHTPRSSKTVTFLRLFAFSYLPALNISRVGVPDERYSRASAGHRWNDQHYLSDSNNKFRVFAGNARIPVVHISPMLSFKAAPILCVYIFHPCTTQSVCTVH